MSRPLRLEFAGAIYHLTARGNARLPIFEDDQDREAFLDLLGDVVERFNWVCHSYCLMDNHYHLLVETIESNLSRGARQLNGVYTQRFNRRHGRVGHVLQGRFKSILVDRDSYLLELCRYVVLNPVRAGMSKHAGEYRWSSYRASAGLSKCPAFLTVDWVLSQFGRGRKAAQGRYREFVAQGRGSGSPWAQLRGQVLLGADAFVESLRSALTEKSEISEVPRRQRLAHRPTLATLLPNRVMDKGRRDDAIREAHRKWGYTLVEIGRHLGLHYSTVSGLVNAPDR